MARLYRLHPDSSYLKVPRVFARVFCDPGTLPGTVRFYEALTSVSLDMDMDIPESGLHASRSGRSSSSRWTRENWIARAWQPKPMSQS
jgi:hypothetical protein